MAVGDSAGVVAAGAGALEPTAAGAGVGDAVERGGDGVAVADGDGLAGSADPPEAAGVDDAGVVAGRAAGEPAAVPANPLSGRTRM